MADDLARALWRKSSRSNGTGQCIEVAENLPDAPIRDSKDPGGPALRFSRAAFAVFVAEVKDGRLDR